MVRILSGLLLLIGTAFLTLSAIQEKPTPPKGRIAYSCPLGDDSSGFTICILDVETLSLKKLPAGTVNSHENCYVPLWSHDGEHLALSCDNGIQVLNSNLEKIAEVVPGPQQSLGRCIWSHDDKKIACNSASSNLYMVNFESRKITVLARDITSDAVAWFPDNQRIALINSSGELEVVDIEKPMYGKKLADCRMPFWSDSYNGLVCEGSIGQLLLINGPGSQTQIMEKNTHMTFGSKVYSPDGSRFAVNVPRENVDHLSIKEIGGSLRRIDDTDGVYAYSWSPDGQWLAYTCFYCKEPGLYAIHKDGKRKTLLKRLPGREQLNYETQNWLPVGVSWGQVSHSIEYDIDEPIKHNLDIYRIMY